MAEAERVTLEILLKDVQPGAPPDAAATARARRALEGAGMVCHPVPFGLVCTATRSQLALLFGPSAAGAGAGDALPVPASLADAVEQITIPRAPEYFG